MDGTDDGSGAGWRGAAFTQTPAEVVIREPGERRLSPPQLLASEAERDWEYAWLSVAAYNGTPAGRKRLAARRPPPSADGEYRSPEEILAARGWVRWQGFPDAALARQIDAAHLRAEVWERARDAVVAVTFGGTVIDNEKDWRSNLRWFLPWDKDEYSTVVNSFAPAFAAELTRRVRESAGAEPRPRRLFATGHSLGGGLAQQFAYALPDVPAGARVERVYAFDPSPVTGYFSVPAAIRRRNVHGLLIDRIYERGEILALLRSLTGFVFPPSAADPAVRGVRYSLFYPADPIAAHSMPELARRLSLAIGHREILA